MSLIDISTYQQCQFAKKYFYRFTPETVREETMRLDPYNMVKGTGVLGRISDELHEKGYQVNAFGIDTDLTALTGRRSDIVKRAAESDVGFQRFNPSADSDTDLISKVTMLNKEGDMYSNFFSEIVSQSMVRNKTCKEKMKCKIYLLLILDYISSSNNGGNICCCRLPVCSRQTNFTTLRRMVQKK